MFRLLSIDLSKVFHVSLQISIIILIIKCFRLFSRTYIVTIYYSAIYIVVIVTTIYKVIIVITIT